MKIIATFFQFGSWKNIAIGHYDSSTIRYELS
jgi:hypothetical protein